MSVSLLNYQPDVKSDYLKLKSKQGPKGVSLFYLFESSVFSILENSAHLYLAIQEAGLFFHCMKQILLLPTIYKAL